MKNLLIIFLVVLFHSLCMGQTNGFKPLKDNAVLLANIEKNSKLINTLESDFVQEKNMSMLTETITSKGYFCFRKENKLRWEYLQPYYYLILLNNGKMVIKDDKHKTNVDGKSNKLFKEINDIMIGGVNGTILKDTKKFKLEFFEDKTLYMVKLNPQNKDLKSMMKRIDIFFEKTDYSVSRIEFIELSDDYTKITFKNKKINTQVPDSKFVVN